VTSPSVTTLGSGGGGSRHVVVINNNIINNIIIIVEVGDGRICVREIDLERIVVSVCKGVVVVVVRSMDG
jgi:hypothetical protein